MPAPGVSITYGQITEPQRVSFSDTIIMLISKTGASAEGLYLVTEAEDITPANGVNTNSDAARSIRAILAQARTGHEQIVVVTYDESTSGDRAEIERAQAAVTAAAGVESAGLAINHKPNLIVNDLSWKSGADELLGASPSTTEISELIATGAALAEQLDALQLIWGPPGLSYTDMDTWARNVTAQRTIFCPSTPVAGTQRLSAPAYVAGAIARMDESPGWWYNPHKAPVFGVTAVEPRLAFSAGINRNDESSQLTLDGALLIVPYKNKWLLWGDRLMTTTNGIDDTAILRIVDHMDRLLTDEALSIGQTLSSRVADVAGLRFRNVLSRHTGDGLALASSAIGTPTISGGMASFPITLTPNRSITSYALTVDVHIT